jgi:tyrosine aminotransferase
MIFFDGFKFPKIVGYAPSTGYLEARKAVAEHIGDGIGPEDVILCSGCSCSLDLCISAVANPGQNILVPLPGFPLYTTLANGLGIKTKEYNLIPENDWQVDLDHMESMIDENTVAILVNNPSNPCGSVFDEAHLTEILKIAEEHCLPIIADEIYEHFVFNGSEKPYTPIAKLSKNVPVLSCGGLTKRYLVPGWRLGWITLHDRNGIFQESGIRKGLHSLSQRIIGANTIVQGALPSILKDTPASFFNETLDIIEANAKLSFEKLSQIPGLRPVMPSGAMYMMVGIDGAGFSKDFSNDLEIVEAMVTEQSVFCLPGKCFNIPNFFRIVLTVPGKLMAEACDRIAEFCEKHYDIHARFELGQQKNIQNKDDNYESSGFSNGSSSSSDEREDDLTTEVTNLKLHPTKIQVARFTNVATRKVSTPTRLA